MGWNPFTSSYGGQLGKIGNADYTSARVQKFLPPELRYQNTGPIFQSGLKGIADLLRNPGGLSPTVSDAIRPRLASESEQIATNFRNLSQEQAGTAARNNLPVSIKSALDAALGFSQERAQREARRSALTDSEQLRRSDTEQFYKLLDAINQFLSSGRNAAVGALGQAAQSEASTDAATLAMIGSIASAAAGGGASNSRFKEGIEPVSEDAILKSVRSLRVYNWRYKGDEARHMGPMAEDFRDKFGLGRDADTINYLDAIGTLMAATQALAKKVDRLEAR